MVIDKRIADIVKNFKTNLKTTLLKKTFDPNSADECGLLKTLPEWCVAFKNGVYDFKENRFLFKYDILRVEGITSRIYQYDPDYAILWYMNFDFTPMDGISIMDIEFEDFIEVLKEFENSHRKLDPDDKAKNLCFELVWNMSHDMQDEFSMDKCRHLCEILGYIVDPIFVQKFVMIIGAGRNGKNSLFDGCFTNKIIPMPTQNSLASIEENRFITGALENRYQNIFLETDEKSASMQSSQNIKQLTGSQFQTIIHKGVDGYPGLINCKFLFSANEQEKIKFGDISTGFRRRINMYEVFYQYDQDLKFMKKNPDYYNTTYSQDLHEISNNLLNSTTFVYLAMYGIKSATKGFRKSFEFTKNDWNDTYSDIAFDLKDKIRAISVDKLMGYMTKNKKEVKSMFVNTDILNPVAWQDSKELNDFGFSGVNAIMNLLKSDEYRNDYFVDHDVFLNLKNLKDIIGENVMSQAIFISNLKRLFANAQIIKTANGKQFVRINLSGNSMRIASK